MSKDLEILTENTEVRLGYYCKRLERVNKTVNTEIEKLLQYAQSEYKYGTFEVNNKLIKQNGKICKDLLKIEVQLVSMIESTLITLNVGKLLK